MNLRCWLRGHQPKVFIETWRWDHNKVSSDGRRGCAVKLKCPKRLIFCARCKTELKGEKGRDGSHDREA